MMITATPQALDAIRRFLAGIGESKQIRIVLQSTGCCDASLGLMTDDVRDDDIVETLQDVRFVISPEVLKLSGGISISCKTDQPDSGFVLTPEKPVSEWDGFGACQIKT